MTATMTREVVVPARRRLTDHRALAPLVVAVMGFSIAIAGIGIPSIWYDEAATISSTTRSWDQLWAELSNVDAVHGLYYAFIHALFDLVGYSPITLRLPSALAVAAAAGCVVVLGRTLAGPRLGIIAGLVFVFIPRVTWAGTEGRSYALTALLAVVVTLVFVRAQRGAQRRWWVLYATLALLATTLFIYLALVVLAHGLTMALRLAYRERMALYYARRWAIAAAIAFAASIPLSLEIVAQGGQVAWIPAVDSATGQKVFATQWFDGAVPFATLAWALIVFGVVDRVRRGIRGPSSTILPALAFPTLALIAISIVHAPLYLPRYLTMSTPFVALAIAAGIAAIRWRFAPVVALALLAALALPSIVAQRSPEAKENASWSQVADFIAADRALDGPGSTTAFIYGNLQRHPSATARVMAYSYPTAFADSIDVTLRTPAAQTAQLWETHAPIAQSTERLLNADVVYLITSNARDLRPETTAVLARSGWRVALTWDFTTGHVIKYERD